MFYSHFLLCAYTINEAILLKGGLSFNTLCRLVKVSSKKTGGAILSKLLHTFDITRNTTLLKVINVKEGRGFFIQTILPSTSRLKPLGLIHVGICLLVEWLSPGLITFILVPDQLWVTTRSHFTVILIWANNPFHHAPNH